LTIFNHGTLLGKVRSDLALERIVPLLPKVLAAGKRRSEAGKERRTVLLFLKTVR
jgi:hypothetical protein